MQDDIENINYYNSCIYWGNPYTRIYILPKNSGENTCMKESVGGNTAKLKPIQIIT